MDERIQEGKPSKVLVLAGIIIVVAALRSAREIFIPIAIATLLSFLLAPLVKRLMKWGFPNVIAVLSAVGSAFVVLGFVAWLVSAQLVNLADELPNYQDNIREKITSISGLGEGRFSRAFEMVGALRQQIAQKSEKAGSGIDQFEVREPVLVEIQDRRPGIIGLLTQYGGPLLTPLGMAGIALVFVIFMLLQRHDLRDRLIKLASGGNLNVATETVDDATRRVTRYLLMQLVVNASYGIPLGIGLFFLGVPNALLWGLLAVLLRFLPFVGAWIAAFFPIVLSIAVEPGWLTPILVIGLIIVLELVSSNFMEPWLYGSTTGISVVALLFAALVWAWIWGPIGLFLSTPLTVCLLVVGKNVPALGFLNVILGSDPVLPPDALFYQRMLQMDADVLFDFAEEQLEDRDLFRFYEQIAIPALILAEQDRHGGTLAVRRQQFITETMRDLLEEFGSRFVQVKKPEGAEPIVIFCVAAQDEADELTAIMFSQILNQAGFRSEISSTAESADKLVQRVLEERAAIIAVCAIPPAAVPSVRKQCRQLRARDIDAKILVGIWDSGKSATAVRRQLTSVSPELVATSLSDALAQLENYRSGIGNQAGVSSGYRESGNESPDFDFEGIPAGELFDTATRRLSRVFDLPISLISIVDTDSQFWRSRPAVLPDQLTPVDELRSSAVSRLVLMADELLVIEDMREEERFSDSPLVMERGIRFYIGAPLRTRNGHVVGSLCIINTEPRKVNGLQRMMLRQIALRFIRAVEAVPQRDKTIEKDS